MILLNMEKYILDTNLFFNIEPGLGVGGNTSEVIKRTTRAFKELKKENKRQFLMPPSIVKEIKSFFEEETQLLKEFFAEITIKSPNITDTMFPASLFYTLVEEIRERSRRGLEVAEDELYKAVSSLAPIELTNKKDIQIKTGLFTKNLRERYRQATRAKFLDSMADLDLIILAKEEDAYLVSTDEGVIVWGRRFGVKEMDPGVFGKILTKV